MISGRGMCGEYCTDGPPCWKMGDNTLEIRELILMMLFYDEDLKPAISFESFPNTTYGYIIFHVII